MTAIFNAVPDLASYPTLADGLQALEQRRIHALLQARAGTTISA